MNKNAILALAIGMLVIGGGVGYVVAVSSQQAVAPSVEEARVSSGQHMMPDGTMMANTTETAPESMDDAMPMDMASMMMDMSEGLVDKTGDEFDQAFLEEMIIHHEGAVDMAELALMNAKHQEIKDLANAIISAQEKEIASMKAWEKSWYGQ